MTGKPGSFHPSLPDQTRWNVIGEESPTGVNASCSPIIQHKDERLDLNYRQVCSGILCVEKDPFWNAKGGGNNFP